MIVTLLLAAGHGRRFGGGKLLATLGGRPVIRWSAEASCAATDATLVVVAPDDLDAIRGALSGLDVQLVAHGGRHAGMATSIAAGIQAVPAGCTAIVIVLADQPLVSSEVMERVSARWRETGAMAVAPRYRDGRGHPVLFDRACFAELAALTGDVGARKVLESLGEAVSTIDVDEPMPLDVDTREALAELEASLAASPQALARPDGEGAPMRTISPRCPARRR